MQRISSNETFIFQQMIEGDKKAFRFIFEKYYAELCNFVNIYINDKSLSEEVVQDVFVYLWENRSKINIKLSVRAYLFGASKYRSLNLLREQKNLARLRKLASSQPDVHDTQQFDSLLNTNELRKIIDEAVFQLPEQCRKIFVMSKFEDLSNKEIANRLGLSIKTVENQITIAIKKMRNLLHPHREKLLLLFLSNVISK